VRSIILALVVLVIVLLVVGTYALLGARERFVRRRKLGPAYAKPTQASRRRHVVVAVTVGAVACLAVAFAQVRLSHRVTEATVILVIDDSRSMNASDVQPNRLTAAETAARAFLRQVPTGFRIGLVTFADTAAVRVAPTDDHGAVADSLGTLALPSQTGTVIGDGLSAALDAIQKDERESGTKAGAVVLLSDGQDTGSAIPPDEAASRAASLGVPVFTVAIVQTSGATDAEGAVLLRRMAETTDAAAFTAQTAGQLTRVYTALGPRLSLELNVGTSAGLFVIAGIAFAIAAAGLLIIWRSPY
jgi:Ca-activated chloride channel family protein